MAESLDQIFVNLKHWLVAMLPPEVQPWAGVVISVAAILLVFATLFAIATVFERKGLGRIQNRPGPNRVGIPFTDISLFGFGQPIADGIKAIIKEEMERAMKLRVPLAVEAGMGKDWFETK